MKTVPRACPLFLLVFLVLATLRLRGGSPPDHSWNPNRATNPPYGLVDLDGFDLGDYVDCRWGVLQSSNFAQFVGVPVTLSFSPLTRGPFTFSGNQDLFLSNSLTELTGWDLLATRTGTWTPPTGGSDGAVSFQAPLGITYNLFRKLHFRDYLEAKFLSNPLPDDARKVIVLIHGWNREGNAYHYQDEFESLYQAIKAQLEGTEWHLVLYHWEEDADTGGGGVNFHPGETTAFGPDATNPTKAATIGHLHGQHLGQLLASFDRLEKTQFISHSAGTWVARAASRYLLSRTSTKIQITLLDPFIPGQMLTDNGTPNQTPFAVTLINALPSLPTMSNGQLVALENIFAHDLMGGGGIDWFPINSDWAYAATSQLFAWPGHLGINLKVDWTPGGTPPIGMAQFYDSHSGPIQFYADTVLAFGKEPRTIAGLQNPSFPLSLIGWKRSLFYNEPIVSSSQSSDNNGGRTLTGRAHLRGDTGSSAGLEYAWERSTTGVEGTWSTFRGFSSSPDLNLTATQVTSSAGLFRLVARNAAGYDTGAPIPVGPAVTPGGTAPPAPTGLVASSIQSSQISLRWNDNSTTETGFRVEWKLKSASWPPPSGQAKLVAAGTGSAATTTITGLTPATEYSFRVRAEASQPSGWSAPQLETATAAAPATNFTVTVYAVDVSTNPVTPLNLVINTWTGTGQNYISLTTAGGTGAIRTMPSSVTGWFNAPPSLTGGRTFRKWLFSNGGNASEDFGNVASLTVTGNVQAYAQYAPGPPPARTLTALAIEGLASVDEADSATYRARATFSDGASTLVTASDWEITSGSSYADISSTGVLDAEAVTSDRTVTISASYTTGGVTKEATKSVTIRNTSTVQTYTLTLNIVGNGDIGYSPRATTYADGTVVSMHANADDGYVFSHWTGDASGTEDDIEIRMTRNKSVTAHFSLDTTIGNIRVDISPPRAVIEGAAWRYHTYTAWRPSGDTQDGLAPRSEKTVYFKDIPGWISPAGIKASIIGGQTATISAAYREILGSVQVTLNPPEAAAAGARWRIDMGPWMESGAALQNVATGDHSLHFQAGGGWTAPAPTSITVQRGIAAVASASFVPPAGLPVIASVTPASGGLDGGYTVSIDGANFGQDSTVTFNGIPSASVIFENSGRITAVVPPGARYGTVPVAVTSGGRTGSKATGFTYSIALSSNMTLMSQIGGTVGAVAASGNMVYFGEGSSIVAADYTNPAAPIIRGRLPLPGLVRDIRISGNHALVANSNFGLQIVDLTNPENLLLVGYYDTPGRALRLSLKDSLAFVADEAGGLQVLDFADRTAPRRVGAFPVGQARDVGVTVIGGNTIVCLASGSPDGILILDASNPAEIRMISQVETSISHFSLALFGSTLVCHGLVTVGSTTGKIYNLTNPSSPVKSHEGSFFQRMDAGIVSGVHLYSGDDALYIYDLSVTPNPTRRSSIALAGRAAGMAMAGNMLYLAKASAGLYAIEVSNPTAPSSRSIINSGFGPTDVSLNGSRIHTAIRGGMTTIAASDLRHPERKGTVASNYELQGIARHGDTVFCAAWRRLTGFSVVNPDAPTLMSSVDPGGDSYAIDVVNGYIVAGGLFENDSGIRPRLWLYTPSGFQSNTPLSTLDLGSSGGLVTAMAVSGNFVYSFVSGVGLKIVNYSDPQAPLVEGSLSYTSSPEQAAVSPDGRYLYVSDGALRIFDCTIRSAPLLLGSYVRDSSISTAPGVAASGNLVFFSDSHQINVLDCTDPHQPSLVAWYDTPGRPYAIKVAGNIVYVADGDGGLQIIEIGDLTQPLVQITQPSPNSAVETTASTIHLSGTASDGQAITRVTWGNDRGGGGVAQGTTVWSIPVIQLAAGVNIITVTAEDAQGNLARDTITVTATLPDNDGPALLVTGPQTATSFTFTEATLPLVGTASDVSRVQTIQWGNDRDGFGTAAGTTSWSASIPLQPGPNGITVTARDTAGNSTQTRLVVIYLPPDALPPSVQITFPTEAQAWATSEEVAFLSGSAADDTGVARVRWSNHRGGQGDAQGTTMWNINGLLLQPGLNVITVTAEDLNGNSISDTLSVTFSPGDADQDGLLDAWEILYFGLLSESGDGDPDSDGQNTATEHATGTNPTSGASSFVATVGTDNQGRITLTWPSLPGLTYRIESARMLGGPWESTAIAVGAAAPAVSSVWTGPAPAGNEPRKFFRVSLE